MSDFWDTDDEQQQPQKLGGLFRQLAGRAASDEGLEQITHHRVVDALGGFFADVTAATVQSLEIGLDNLSAANDYLDTRNASEESRDGAMFHLLAHKISPLLNFSMYEDSPVYLYGAPRLEEVMQIPTFLELHMTARELDVAVELQGYDAADSKGPYGVRINLLKSYEEGRAANPGTYPSEESLAMVEEQVQKAQQQERAAQKEFQERVTKGEDPKEVYQDIQRRMAEGVLGTEADVTKPAPEPDMSQRMLPPGPPPEAPQAKSLQKGKFKL